MRGRRIGFHKWYGYNIHLLIITLLVIFSSGCLKDTNEAIDPEYNITVDEVSLQNQSLIGEVLTNNSNVFLLLKIDISNENSDFGLGLGASAFWISTINETDIWWNSDIDGFEVVEPGEIHTFSIDFIIPKDEIAKYLHCDLFNQRSSKII